MKTYSLIISAMDEEMEALLKLLPDLNKVTIKGEELYEFELNKRKDLVIQLENQRKEKYNQAVNYTVEVLVAQYLNRYESANAYGSNGNRYVKLDTLSYVDRTSEYATLFGLDANNQAKAIAGSAMCRMMSKEKAST